jgi:hypothetical protein
MPSYFITDSEGNVLEAYQGPAAGAPEGGVLVADSLFAELSNNITGYTFNGTELIPVTPPPVTPPTIAQQAAAAILQGVTISLTGSMTLEPTLFPCDPVTTTKISTVLNILNATGLFPDGTTTCAMKDMGNPSAWHSFTGPQYTAVVLAIGNYVFLLDQIADGNPAYTTLPNPVIPTITV